MTLPAEVQTHVDQIRALIGAPASQLVLNIDRAGIVQSIESRVIFSRAEQIALDRRTAPRV